MKTDELFWDILPEGLGDYFELERYDKADEVFRITLIEKAVVPEDLPREYWGKRILDSTTNLFVFEDFPLRGREVKIFLKRRAWKFEGVDKWYKRDLKLCVGGTKLEKEFAIFLKEPDRE